MVELPPSEGGEATITAMSALAAVGQYLSTNSAKSTFLRNTGLVVKAISSKLPHDQDMQAQINVVSALQTQVHSLTETLCETRRNIAQCRQDILGFDHIKANSLGLTFSNRRGKERVLEVLKKFLKSEYGMEIDTSYL